MSDGRADDEHAVNAAAAVRTASYYDELWRSLDEPDDDDKLRLAFVSFALGRIPRAERLAILDLGCGSGWMAPELARWGQVTGVDFSATAILRARDRFGAHASFVLAESGSPTLGLPTGGFDVVISSDVIEHVPRPKALLRQAAEFLRPGGWLVLTTPNGSVWPEYEALFRGRLQPIENWIAPEPLVQLLSEAGFEVLLHEGVPSPALRLGAFPIRQHSGVRRAFSALGLERTYGRLVRSTALYQGVIARRRSAA